MRAAADSYSGHKIDFMKQTMLEHEAVFKNQVHELHRLYRIQRNLVDEGKETNLNLDMNLSNHTSENASKRHLPGFLLANSACGEGSSSQACNSRLLNGVISKDRDVFEVRPVKVRRKVIDLEIPADEYLDTDETGDTDEHTIRIPYKRSKSGKDDASHRTNSSGSCLDVKNSNGLADLNEPLKWQESDPVALSRDMYSHYGRNNADVQGHWLEKNTSQNGWMVLEAGHDRSSQRDQLHLPSHPVQVLSNNAFQPLTYPSTDHSELKYSGERAYRELEFRSRNPQVSYDSYIESSVASKAPSIHNDYYGHDFFRPWSHWSSSRENPRSSSHQKSYPVQTNPLFNFGTHARADSSFEMRSNGFYQGFSSGSKETFFNIQSAGLESTASLGEVMKQQSFERLQGPKKQECSAGLPWLKPKPPCKSEISTGCLDLNAFMDGTDTGEGLSSVSPQKALRSALCSNNGNLGRVEMIDPQSSRKLLGCPIFEKHSICEEKHTPLLSHSSCIITEEVNSLVKRGIDMNLPYDASVSEENKGANIKHYIDLNSCASEDDEDSSLHSSLRVKSKAKAWIDLEAPAPLESEEEEGESSQLNTNEETWGLMHLEDGNSMNELIKVAAEAIVAISSSDHKRHPDDAASSSTNAASKDPLSWFAGVVSCCSDELERKVDVYFEGYREECSSGEIDYFEDMSLNLEQTKEEEYMPEPLVPENLKLEGTGCNRLRRGQARRGRPKRDFQRDILPGLSSLSRQEVNEDIQMFGGLVKTWNSGVAARRNSKRKISQAPVVESVSVAEFEDSSTLTGWGKATRRPRRQRCPPATFILT